LGELTENLLLVCYWHKVAVLVVLNSDQKHGFFKSGKSEKAAIRFREIPVNLMGRFTADQHQQPPFRAG